MSPRRRRLHAWLGCAAALAICAGGAAGAPRTARTTDPAGRPLGLSPHRARAVAPAGAGIVGAYCDSCGDPQTYLNPDVAPLVFGVEFRRGELWTLGYDGTLTRLAGCRPVQSVAVQGFRGFGTGLGYDARRDQFIVVDALIDSVFVVDLHGAIQRAYAAPGSGCIGAAYDSTRDAYWFTDFEQDSLYAIDALHGGRVAAFPLPGGVLVAGAAYDASLDAILYEDRSGESQVWVMSCRTGALLATYPLPFTGLIPWEDNALAPDGSLWIHNFDLARIYCINGFAAAVRRAAAAAGAHPPAGSRSAPPPGR